MPFEIPLSSPLEKRIYEHALANRASELEKTHHCRVLVLECASPLALSMTYDVQSARGLAHSKTWRRCELLTGRVMVRSNSRFARRK
jgi:hypothetical protein